MRLNPEDTSPEHETGRIIYLGDVRRRRAVKRLTPDLHYIAALALVGAASWAVWLTVIFSLPPARLLTYLAFFIPLALAVICTAAVVSYAAEWRMGRLPDLKTPIRRGALFSAVLIANLAFQAAHHWSLIVFGVAALLAVAAEAAVGHRDF